MSSSDYLAIKKRRASPQFFPSRSSSCLTSNKQYYNIQSTPIVDEDGDLIPFSERFSIKITQYCDLADFDDGAENSFQPMFVVPRIHIPEYIKNRYQAPFCWTCKSSLTEDEVDRIINDVGCEMCDVVKMLKEAGIFNTPELIAEYSTAEIKEGDFDNTTPYFTMSMAPLLTYDKGKKV
jgi:hypothetical protein